MPVFALASASRRPFRARSRLRASALAAGAAAAALVLGLSGCSGSGSGSPEAPAIGADDARALGDLARIAPEDADRGEAPVGAVDCWLPSASMVDDDSFRVICRVHYQDSGEPSSERGRYRDMICIGRLTDEPVTDHCYPWVPYSDMPAFDDREAFSA